MNDYAQAAELPPYVGLRNVGYLFLWRYGR